MVKGTMTSEEEILCALEDLYREHRALLRGQYAAKLQEKGLAGELERPVFSRGKRKSPRLMLIGEAPGREETELGMPFVGKAGRQLSQLLAAAGLEEGEIFISNTVKYRPYKLSAKGTRSNRTPVPLEVEAGIALLRREIDLVQPKVIATLGNTPLQALSGKDHTIGGLHGRPFAAGNVLLFPLYHPASAIYNPALKPVLAADLAALGQYLAEF